MKKFEHLRRIILYTGFLQKFSPVQQARIEGTREVAVVPGVKITAIMKAGYIELRLGWLM